MNYGNTYNFQIILRYGNEDRRSENLILLFFLKIIIYNKYNMIKYDYLNR